MLDMVDVMMPQVTSEKNAVMLAVLPFYHIYGACDLELPSR